MANRRPLLAVAALALLGGCDLAPRTAPAAAPPPAYGEGWQLAGAHVPPPGPWWQSFGDATLDDFEAQLGAQNLDLAAASARHDEALALARQAGAALLPTVTASGGADAQRLSALRPLGTGSAVNYSETTAGASLAWQVDLFGGLRNQLRAGTANARAAGYDADTLRAALQGQLASTFFDLRGLDARIALLQQTTASYQRAFTLTDTRHRGGIASGLDVGRAQAQLSSAEAELATTRLARADAAHAIAVLLGEAPAALTIAAADAPGAVPLIAPGVPSALLERRPDIAAAAARVAAANAGIGVARAALYPNITLGAGGGFDSTHGDLVSTAASYWALGPLAAALTVFDGGRRRAGVALARAQQAEASDNFKQTVLTAMREVEDDLAAQRLLAEAETAQQTAAAAAARTAALAMVQYRDGAADYLAVSTAQTAALDAARAALLLRTQRLQAAADLYRALGGEAPLAPGSLPSPP